jgi:two-component system chemotaxis sensor kinase CheA
VSPLEPTRDTLDDAAAFLVQLEPDDREGLGRLCELLQAASSGAGWPPPVEELVGRALWRVMDAIDGDAEGLADAGTCLEQAMELLEGAPPPSPLPAEEDEDEPAEVSLSSGGEARPVGETASVPPVPEPSPAPSSEGEVELVPPDADAELLADFVAEAGEYLAAAEGALLELEADPHDHEAINTVFRAFHTIKGTSGFARAQLITDLAHRAESVLVRIRNGEIVLAGPYADLALRSIDMLKTLLGAIDGKGPGVRGALPDGYGELLEVLTRVGTGGEAIPTAPAVAPASAAAPTQPAEATRAHAEPAGESSIRVRIDRLDRLIDMVGELVIAHSMVAQDAHVAGVLGDGLLNSEDELARKVVHAGKIVRDLQDLSLSLRMVPLRPTFQRLARAVRDVARQVGREVVLVAEGEDTEIDRNMVDVVADPLLHMIRNAIDHGIEPPDERERRGKPRTGTIWLRASHGGGSVVVEVRDDGRGLDRDRIAAKAVDRGLIASAAGLSDAEVYDLIFEPGFSTAEKISDISGRGVGMDVVRTAVEALRGRVEIASEPGKGTTFTLRLPLTLAITDGMVVRVGQERYIVPTASIHISFRPGRSQLSTVSGRGELVRLRHEMLPIFRLARLYDVAGAVDDPTEALLVVVDDADRRCALLVDDLLGQQQVVAKPLGSYVGAVDGLSGGAILGDGRVGLILDTFELAGLARRQPTRRASEPTTERSAMSDGAAKPTASTPRTTGGKFLTFFLADEEYGLEILKVQEIIGMLPITRVPRTPTFVKGVINLRGKVIPVTDLRLKLGMEPVEPTPETCTVVVRAAGVEVGLIVDRVSEVADVAPDDVEPTPSFGPDVGTEYILGIAKANGGVKLLLDIDRVLSVQDVVDIRATAAQAAAS